jgi:acetolactate synthase-1/2/3 large subunit
VAEAYGALGLRAQKPSEVGPALRRAIETDGPVIIDFRVRPEENVFPMVPPGSAINEMIRGESK